MRITLVAALDRAGGIGRGNDLPWRLPADLKRFKARTLGKPVLMGRKTAQSLGRALPGRRNLVLTRSGQGPFDGMEAVATIQAALLAARDTGADELCVMGGAEVYAQILPMATTMFLTHVDTEVRDADAFFPDFDTREWTVMARETHPADAQHPFAFEFVDYARVTGA